MRNSLYFIFITSATIMLASCAGRVNDFLPAQERFFCYRDTKPMKGEVKSVMERKTESDTGANSQDREVERNEYFFKQNGYLYKWNSYYGNEVDLKYTSEGIGLVTTKFGDGRVKKETGSWSEKPGYHILEINTKVDGQQYQRRVKTYDTSYRLLTDEESGNDGKTYISSYKYENDKLKEVNEGDQIKIYSNNLLDSITGLYGYNSGKTVKYRYNGQGDMISCISFKNGMPEYEIKNDYTYDSRGNWVTRRQKATNSKRVTSTVRVIEYY